MVVYLSAKATSCACLEHALHNAHCYDECKHTASVMINANTRPSEDESETFLQYSGLTAGTKSNNKRNNRIAASSHEDRRRDPWAVYTYLDQVDKLLGRQQNLQS